MFCGLVGENSQLEEPGDEQEAAGVHSAPPGQAASQGWQLSRYSSCLGIVS